MTEGGELPRILPNFSGAALLTREGQVLLREATGVADVETGERLTPESIFQLCSLSKQVTAAAVLVLCEAGVLDLHAPLARWISEIPAEDWPPITLHHVLSCTSGLGHWDVVPGFDPLNPMATGEFLDQFVRLPLLFAPGRRWSYSSPGFLLAALAIERAAGEPYAAVVRRRIFDPLGMDSTSASIPRRAPARGHSANSRVDVPAFAMLPGAGDLWSTVDDLARFAAALDAGAFLGDESRRLLTTVHSPLPAKHTAAKDVLTVEGYGYGYLIGSLLGHSVRYHPGDNPGFRTFQLRCPDLDVSAVVLSNQEETDIEQAGLRLLTNFLRA